MNEGRNPKFCIEIQESESGEYYLRSLKVNVDTVEEMEQLTNQMLPKITIKLAQLNRNVLESYLDEIILSPKENELFHYLKEKRLEIANQEDVPAYVVFPDKTLILMARTLPKTKDEMIALHGVGEEKLEKYGERYIQAVGDYNDSNGFSFFGTLQLNAESIEEMEKSFDLALHRIPSKVTSASKKTSKITSAVKLTEKDLDPDDRKLYEYLRSLRRQTAKEEIISDYFIFTNSVLIAMAKKRPKTMEEMIEIRGVGPKNYANYGEKFIEAIEKYEASN